MAYRIDEVGDENYCLKVGDPHTDLLFTCY